MKNVFPEYNSLTEEIVKDLWEKAFFVFDANVLLNLYRYSDETSQKFLETIVELKERIWLPYQIGFEFNKKRLSVISDQKRLYKDFERKFNDIISEVENKNRNPFLSNQLFKKLRAIKSEIKIEIDKKIESYEVKFNSDSLLDKINLAFEGKVGDSLNIEELKQIYLEGQKRYTDRIPPGYCDLKKPEVDKYGDLIIWKQMLSKAKDSEIDIIFISEDGKEDWWLEEDGKTISPRPELLKEFRNETKRKCHFYKPFQFLNYSSEFLGKTIKREVIEEVKNHEYATLLNDKFLQLKLTVNGKIEDLVLLIQEIKNAGYNILPFYSDTNNLHELLITLPNIPDLERRFVAKYISKLEYYNLELINTVKK